MCDTLSKKQANSFIANNKIDYKTLKEFMLTSK